MSSFKGRNTLLPSNDLSKSEIKDKPISLIFLTHVCLVFRFLSFKPVHFRPYAFQEKGAKLVATMNPRALRSGCTLCVHRLSVFILFFCLFIFFSSYAVVVLFCLSSSGLWQEKLLRKNTKTSVYFTLASGLT